MLRLARLLNFAKSLLDQGEGLPTPAPLAPGVITAADRRDLGRRLLAAFLHDGILRGADQTGRWWPQPAAIGLADRFRRAMRQVPIRGSGHCGGL